MANETSQQRSPVFRILPSVIVLGFCFMLILIATEPHNRPSLKKTYDEIELGMSRNQATSIIRSQDIYCGFADPQGDSLNVVRFYDFWRSYKIWLDPKTGTVAGKQFFWTLRREPIRNLFRAARSLF